jgi:hypothetical protein
MFCVGYDDAIGTLARADDAGVAPPTSVHILTALISQLPAVAGVICIVAGPDAGAGDLLLEHPPIQIVTAAANSNLHAFLFSIVRLLPAPD